MDILESRMKALEDKVRKKTVFTGIVMNVIFDDDGEDVVTFPLYNVTINQAEILMKNQRRRSF